MRSHIDWKGERTFLIRIQMVSEPDPGRCASEDTGSPMKMDCKIPNWLESGTKHSL